MLQVANPSVSSFSSDEIPDTSLSDGLLLLPCRATDRPRCGNGNIGTIAKVQQGLSAAKDAVRMARIAKFYERLPKGPAPEIKSSGLLGRYQDKYFGKNASAAR